MSNIPQNPYNIYPQGQYQQNYAVPSKGVDDIKRHNDMAGKIAETITPDTEKPNHPIKSFLYGTLMSLGFVKGTNWLMQTKNVTDNMTQLEAYQNSRLYKIGAKMDNFGPLKWITTKFNGLKARLGKIPLPESIKEFGRRYKIGTKSTWDKLGMYTVGKHAEAMNETVEFLSQVSDKALGTLKLSISDKKKLFDIMKKVRAEKMDKMLAYKELEPMIQKLSAKALKDISIKDGAVAKIFGTTKDLSLSASKAKFFSGANSSGPVGKFFNKVTALFGEASGGGVLGGTQALLMNAAGIAMSINSSLKADKGDKFKTFMEEYLGFTIGGYIMGMVVGKVFNSTLSWTEFGMNLKLAQQEAKKLGVVGAKTVQDAFIAYNKEFDNVKKLREINKKFAKGKVVASDGTFFGWLKRKLTGKKSFEDVQGILKKCGSDVKATDAKTLQKEVQKILNVKTPEFFEGIRKNLKSAYSSGIKIKSLADKTSGKKFIDRFVEVCLQKPASRIGKLLSVGKYTLHHSKGNFIGNFARKFKRIGGGIGRMWLIGFVLVGPFQKLGMKISHAIFGKPKKSNLDEENQQEGNQATDQTVNSQQGINPQTINNVSQNQQLQNQPSYNLVDLYTKSAQNQVPQTQTTQAGQIGSAQPAQTQNRGSANQDTATYVPNQILAQESYIDPNLTQDLLTRRDLALQHADSAERNALELLKRI